MLSKLVLWGTGVILGSYGIACLLSPILPAGYIGYDLMGADAFIEISAMYGGLQIGLGLWCIYAAINHHYSHAALISIVCIVGGLIAGRLIGFSYAGGEPSEYTYGAIVYESTTTLLALICLIKKS